MNQAVVDAISAIIREKNIDRETFQEIIEQVFMKAIEKRYGENDNFTVIFNLEKGDIEIYAEKEVVPDGEVENEATEIELTRAKKIDEDLEIGDEFVEVIDYNSFGRRLVLSTKQNLIQKIKEIEKQNLYDEFSKRIGEIVIGDVHQINKYELRINVDKTEVIMPHGEQIYNERYRRGQSVKAIITEVRETNREPEIIVSRRSEMFVRRLFEIEVPEIYDGIVEIKAIAREAGDRTKIAVISNDRRVDPVGACVGMKGVRIQAIVRELNNEKIDIIHWTQDRELMVRRSLAPVIPLEIIFHDSEQSAEGHRPRVTVVIPDDQMSMAIGRRGQNIRLACEITNHQIEPVKESEFYLEELPLEDVEELTDEQYDILIAAGYTTADEIVDRGIEAITEIGEFDDEEANALFEILESYFDETVGEPVVHNSLSMSRSNQGADEGESEPAFLPGMKSGPFEMPDLAIAEPLNSDGPDEDEEAESDGPEMVIIDDDDDDSIIPDTVVSQAPVEDEDAGEDTGEEEVPVEQPVGNDEADDDQPERSTATPDPADVTEDESETPSPGDSAGN
jgi:N utilization substance protein A